MDVIIENVSKRFQARNMAVIALKNISTSFQENQISIIYGPSGSGKSVLLNLISGLDTPDSGSIVIGGNEISSMSWSERNMFRRKYISYCMQKNILIPHLKVGLNISLPLLIRGVDKKKAMGEAYELAKRLGIQDTFDRKAYTLSGGEQRRVMIARALILKAKLVLIDEPAANLDEENILRVRDVILEYYRTYRPTIIISTHNNLIMDMGSRRVKIKDGVIINN